MKTALKWKALPMRNGDFFRQVVNEHDEPVCKVHLCSGSAMDNLNLILAAPGLLAALKHARQCLEIANENGDIIDTLWAGDAETLFDFIDTAIAKVTEGAA